MVCNLGAATAMLSPAQLVLADSKSEVCAGANAASGGTGCGNTTGDLNRIITTGINLFSIIIGITAVVMMMVGGFKYITASGDSSKITSAKHTVIYALIGLVIVGLSQVLVQFVLDKAI
jgi:hypothetical protein